MRRRRGRDKDGDSSVLEEGGGCVRPAARSPVDGQRRSDYYHGMRD